MADQTLVRSHDESHPGTPASNTLLAQASSFGQGTIVAGDVSVAQEINEGIIVGRWMGGERGAAPPVLFARSESVPLSSASEGAMPTLR
jgi:hypothetical protein